MADSAVIQGSFSTYYRMIQTRVHELVEPLSEEQIWKRPYPYGNSVGNLILHLTGNLSYYIGAQIGGTGYVRHRPLEFSDSGKPKAEILRAFDQTIDTVLATIAKQSDDDWSAPFFGQLEAESKTRFSAFLSCAAHAYHHVGQMIYLQRELLGKTE
jgi:uncharacterized damage-inducible protein DinB